MTLQTLVMLPTYNERDNLQPIVEKILGLSKEIGVVIVDDSSPDGTGEIADELAKRYGQRVHVIHRKERGRGTAGIAGFQYIVTQPVKYAIEMDVDFSHNPKHIPEFLKEIEGVDVVVGSRFVQGGRDIDRGIQRRIISRISRFIYRLILGLPIQDVGSGYKCYRKEVLASLPWERFYSTSIGISMEELFRIARKGYKIKEIPIHFVDRRAGKSKLGLRGYLEPSIVGIRLVFELGRA
ncbi:MAG: polyprenol monophosphomannose synthase [bacterium]|nr:polyprenol monophosphomannose synthase [bacterium]